MPISFLTTALLIVSVITNLTDTVFTMKIGVEIVVLMYLGFLISTVGYDKVIQMLKQIQSVKEETKNE